MTNVQPITPAEILSSKQKVIPSEVFEAFNELIVKNFDGTSATVVQDDVAELVLQKLLGLAPLGLAPQEEESESLRKRIFDEHWLDIEELYRKAGWRVEYDKPAYYETYPATFTFTKKRSARKK